MKGFFTKQRQTIFVISVCLLILLIYIGGAKKANAQANLPEDIAIAAIVEKWLYLAVSPLTVDIEPALIGADGSLNIGTSPEIVFSVGTNNPNGWYIEMKGENNGLKSSTMDLTINSVSATSTLLGGTDGYGANATSTLSGVLIGELYDYYGTDTVGEIINQYKFLASNPGINPLTDVLKMQIKAAASITTPPAADYSDIIFITLTPII